MKRNNLLFLCCIFFQISFAQEKLIHGKIEANGNFTEGINIVNLVNEKSTVSDANGEFLILAKEDDLLVFSSMNFEYKRKMISKEDVDSGKIAIDMIPKINQIDVVVIEEYRLDAVDLGILSRPAKKYTPAERRLQTAGDFKPIHLIGLLGGSLQIDPIINAINGRTKRLKGEVQVERKEFLLQQINDAIKDDFYVQTLKIHPDNVGQFKYFMMDSSDFISVLKTKNRVQIEVALIKLSQIYKELQANEK